MQVRPTAPNALVESGKSAESGHGRHASRPSGIQMSRTGGDLGQDETRKPGVMQVISFLTVAGRQSRWHVAVRLRSRDPHPEHLLGAPRQLLPQQPLLVGERDDGDGDAVMYLRMPGESAECSGW